MEPPSAEFSKCLELTLTASLGTSLEAPSCSGSRDNGLRSGSMPSHHPIVSGSKAVLESNSRSVQPNYSQQHDNAIQHAASNNSMEDVVVESNSSDAVIMPATLIPPPPPPMHPHVASSSGRIPSLSDTCVPPSVGTVPATIARGNAPAAPGSAPHPAARPQGHAAANTANPFAASYLQLRTSMKQQQQQSRSTAAAASQSNVAASAHADSTPAADALVLRGLTTTRCLVIDALSPRSRTRRTTLTS